jgi:hypothetical protein
MSEQSSTTRNLNEEERKKKKLLFEIDVNFFNVSQEKWEEKNEGGQKEI